MKAAKKRGQLHDLEGLELNSAHREAEAKYFTLLHDPDSNCSEGFVRVEARHRISKKKVCSDNRNMNSRIPRRNVEITYHLLVEQAQLTISQDLTVLKIRTAACKALVSAGEGASKARALQYSCKHGIAKDIPKHLCFFWDQQKTS